MELAFNQQQEIINTYLLTNSQTETARITQHSTATVWKYLNIAGYGVGKGGNQKKKITDAQLRTACKTMTRAEIAKAFDMHPESVARRMKQIGCYGLKTKQDGTSVFSHRGKENGNFKSETQWKNDVARKNTAYEFVSYNRQNQHVLIQCKSCGDILDRHYSTVRKNAVVCKNCKKLKEERKNLHDVLALVIEVKTPRICAVCGSTFFSQYASKKYCSEKCKRKAKGNSNIRKRCKKYGVEYKPGISLMSVYKRDKGVCQICGKPTDFEDKSWNGSFGAMYPTIDHRLALAKGGSHTWENVQLAHAICNSFKRDVAEDTGREERT